MPKMEIDYSNTIIYKISCKDLSVKDVYVGHTTNFVQRKHAHKQCCTNNKSSNYNCKLYKTIRTNGGWDNWIMEIVSFFKCNNHYEARIKEQEYFTSLNATLNSIEPLPKPKPLDTQLIEEVINKKVYFCETCNIKLQSAHLLKIHNKTKKHCKRLIDFKTKMPQFNPLFCCEKNEKNYECINCHFKCCFLSDWKRHLTTRKHIELVNGNEFTKKNDASRHKCEYCEKMYKTQSGLWKHRTKCIYSNKNDNISKNTQDLDSPIVASENVIANAIIDQYTILSILKQNNELQQLIIEQNKTIIELSKNNQMQNTTTYIS